MPASGIDRVAAWWHTRRRLFAGAALSGTLLLTLLALVLPRDQIRWLRVTFDWLNWVMGVLENASTHVNLIHAILFFALGGTAAWALPRWRQPSLIGSLAALAMMSELSQFHIPGRHPRLSDVVVDIVASAAGVFLARLVARVRSAA